MSRESKKKAFFHNQAREIAEDGFSTLSVGGTPSFSYTIGLYKSYAHPELIVFGLPPATAAGLLRDIALKAREGTPFNLSEPTDKLLADCDVLFVEVPKSAFAQYALSAVRYYGEEEFPSFQVVWPSAFDGHYPWDSDADPEFVAIQPVLGRPNDHG
jgi:Domain of unknown function (DUF4262)